MKSLYPTIEINKTKRAFYKRKICIRIKYIIFVGEIETTSGGGLI